MVKIIELLDEYLITIELPIAIGINHLTISPTLKILQ